MALQIQTQYGFRYVDAGNGPTLLLLHGLFGALSNWQEVVEAFQDQYRILIPMLPITDGHEMTPQVEPSVEALADYVSQFTEALGQRDLTLIGNSLGGHIALVYALRHPERVNALLLTGSSGLFEAGMGSGMPRRGDTQYIKDRVEFTFYDPSTATEALIEEVFGLVNEPRKAIRIVQIARNAQRTNMAEVIPNILIPTCLIWGLNDNITPVHVAYEFHQLIPNSELHFIDKCGHAAMMERPTRFIELTKRWLQRLGRAAA